MTREAVIVSGARTAIGTAYRGSLAEVDALELGTRAIAEAVRRSGLDASLVDNVVMGESLYGGGDIGRYAAIEAGLVNAPGVAHNRHCASGLAALQSAAASVIAGMDPGRGRGRRPVQLDRPQGEPAGTRDRYLGRGLARAQPPGDAGRPDPGHDDHRRLERRGRAGLTREEMDAWAWRSHQRAVAGIDAGNFADEIFPLEVTRRDGTRFTFAVDEHPRRSSTLDKLASLKPLHPEIEGFSITAGNAAGVNDGAAAMVVTDRAFAEEHGLEPLAVVRAWASAGVPPADTGLAPPVAIGKALGRAGLSVGDVALWEINEAFASVSVAATRALGLDEDTVNVLGSGCSLGHPVAMTGARMVLTLTHELRRRGGGTGVAAMCAGGGMATALVLDVPPAS